MTVNSNSSAYSSYSSSNVSSSSQRVKPDFEKMAQELLTSMDTDSNGSIDKTEFSTAVQALDSSSSSSKSATDIFNTLDANSDGSMSSEELMSALKNTKPPEPPQDKGQEGGTPPPPPPPSDSSASSSESSSLSEIFSSLDTNKDGTISANELMALLDDSKSKSGDTTSTSASSTSQTDTSTNQLSKNLLKQILTSYGSNSSTNATSQLSLSA